MANKSLKFLMVLNDMAWFWSHRLPLAHAIEKRGWTLNVVAHRAHKDEKLKDSNFKGIGLPPLGRSLNPIPQIQLMLAIYDIIHREKPDIIHVITIRYAFYTGLVTRLMGYKPVTFTVAGLGSLYTDPGVKMKVMRKIVLPLMRFAFGGKGKRIIFQNPDDRQKMIDTQIVKFENTALIRGSGVDLTEFPFSVYEETKEEPIILFTSRLLLEKGITDFIEAARLLKNKGVKARFVVAGNIYPDNARSLTKKQIVTPHDEGIIEWMGQVEDMPALLKSSMMVVLPSYYGEGVPKVLLEAAAVGRPIITCDVPGCREAVEHEANGLLVLPQCPTDLAQAIEKLISDPQKRDAYGKVGRKRVEEDFHVDHVVEQTMAVYDDLLS